MLDEHPTRVHPVLQDVRLDLVGGGLPLLGEVGVVVDPRQPCPPVARHPAHHLGGDEVLGLAPDLPDPAVGLAPMGDRALHGPLQQGPYTLR